MLETLAVLLILFAPAPFPRGKRIVLMERDLVGKWCMSVNQIYAWEMEFKSDGKYACKSSWTGRWWVRNNHLYILERTSDQVPYSMLTFRLNPVTMEGVQVHPERAVPDRVRLFRRD